MKKLYHLRNLGGGCIVALSLLGLTLSAQVVRNYTVTYSENLKGGHTVFGNTILADAATYMNYFTLDPATGTTSIYGNDRSNMQYVDIDGDNTTFNSSSADLVLPAGSNTIKFARLYWGGRIDDDDANYVNRRTVKIKKAGAYQTITAPATQIDERNLTGTDHYAYQAFIDVTAFINSGGTGTYTVADIKVSTGNMGGGGGYYGGWAIVVVYQNLALNYSSIRAYDGFLQVYNEGNPITQSITLTGLNVPGELINASDAYMSTMSWEGDANLAASGGTNNEGDFMKVNGVKVTNALNPVTNFWNGTISKNGVFVETKNPNYKNQMGIDIDEQQVGTGYNLPSGTSNITVEFGTEADQYFPSVFAFTIKAKEPTVILDKTGITSINPPLVLNPNEEITYTLSGINTGLGLAYNCIITDTIPNGLTYKPGSLVIVESPGGIKGPKTDITGDDHACFDSVTTPVKKRFVKFYIGDEATASAGGHMHSTGFYSVEFKCITPANATALNSVTNTGRITGHGEDLTPFVDDGTFVIGPEGSPLKVKMTLFAVTKEGNNANLRWVTESEEDNDRYEVERSNDGTNFRVVGMVAGSGTTTDTRSYAYTDPLFSYDKMVYYRLRIVDKDEKITYSKVLALRVNDIISNFSVYPNPFVNELKLQISSVKDAQVQVRISNAAGQVVINRMIRINNGLNIVVVKDIAAQQAGIYILELITEDERLVQKLIKK